jgi:hypothetical protein
MKALTVPCGVQLSRCSRRRFLLTGTGLALAPGFLGELAGRVTAGIKEGPVHLGGPGSRYVARLHAAFVRRAGDYGMRWPGAIYDGEAARRQYTQQLRAAEAALGLRITLRPEAIHSAEEADAWLATAKADRPDGLFLALLDRQEHAWPTVTKAIDTQIPTVVFAPIGTAFTTNTAAPAARSGVYLCSTDDFSQARYGLKMVRAAAKLREMRYIVLQGTEGREARLPHFGTRLRYLPARVFLEAYEQTPVTDEVRAWAKAYRRGARRVAGPTQEDLHHGIKSYVVARQILEREEGDGITMDCLGALGQTRVSLPCIAWSKMLDQGIPAACEADLGAAVTHALVQFLFDRPGFEQDPVPETGRGCLIGAHCTCPTRLNGFAAKPEPYELSHHHGKRDAVPKPIWRRGQRVTVADVILPGEAGRVGTSDPPQLVLSTGTVVDNVAVPPAGGCVVSVMVKLDGEPDLLRYPGFHQLIFYGDFKQPLLAYCQLFGLRPVVA